MAEVLSETYTGGLADYIQKELKLFTVDTIEEATVKAIAIEVRNKRTDKKDDRSKPINKTDWQKKGKQSKEGQTQKVYCDHYQTSIHAKDKCWILHHELWPKREKNNEGRNDRKATLVAQQAEELPELKQPDVTLTLMTRPANTKDTYNREELFHVNIQVKQSVVQAIIDPGSQKNLISKALVILGSPYLWDRDVIHYQRLHKYRLVKDGKEFHINACKPQATDNLLTDNLLTANQATRGKLQEKFKDLFQDVHGLPPRRAVEHEIQLVGDSPLLNLGLYRTSVTESNEIKKHIQGLLEQGVIKPSYSPCGSPMLLVPKKDGGWPPLHSLTKANQRFEWLRNHEESFQLLKGKITEAPVLALLNLQRPFEVEADASNYAMGAVLFQDGKLVTYHFEMFSGPVLNYPTYDKELYVMHQAVKHWRAYLLGKEVVVHSDHKPLLFLTTQSKLQQARHMKWMSFLQQFNIVIKYKKGTTNKLADMLFRPPTPVSSVLLVTMQIQLIVPSEYAKGYDTDTDFSLCQATTRKD
ncbi:PREDICTED: uncharacterized protein LOC107880736 [Prunus mume]|uniref:Uncharacterized protein LOC107880736 n=1 Tax=Prunus mume TaxID=102107 RepID=A0ABM1LLP5_PRUMU|nr:PREDICTED: uncharacterized protein LOC107880736 [Prunus mume]